MFNKEDIMIIEFKDDYGITGSIDMVAIFNKNTPEEEVKKAIELNGLMYNGNVIIVTKDQYERVFLGGRK